MAALLRSGQRPRRDVVFSGVVQEEIGGEGAVHWVQNLDYAVDLVVLGEPSDNQIALGHRGIVQMWLTFHGRSVHASVPQAGVNPNWALAGFLNSLQSAKSSLKAHPVLGETTVAPTIIEVDTKSTNVIPAWTRVLLDFRTGAESMNSLQTFVHELAAAWPHSISNAWCPPETPFDDSDETIFGFYTAPENETAVRAQKLISQAVGYEVPFSSYQFATDGRHFVPYNLTMIGYAASEENQAHVVDESISISKMAESLRGHVALLANY
jgi:acetylornithine deacetylase/succinyl-diaminopimelate desuccinylase-like protein